MLPLLTLGAYWVARTGALKYHVATRSYGEVVTLCQQRFVVWDSQPRSRTESKVRPCTQCLDRATALSWAA